MTSDRSAMDPLGFLNLLCFLVEVEAEFPGSHGCWEAGLTHVFVDISCGRRRVVLEPAAAAVALRPPISEPGRDGSWEDHSLKINLEASYKALPMLS